MAGQTGQCRWILRGLLFAVLVSGVGRAGIVLAAADMAEEFPVFDDQPLDEPLGYPDWFKLSFLDIGDDAREAAAAGKRGLMIYVGQKYCPYCKTLLETNFGMQDISEYTQFWNNRPKTTSFFPIGSIDYRRSVHSWIRPQKGSSVSYRS